MKYTIIYGAKDASFEVLFRRKKFGHSLYDIVQLQTSLAVWNDVEAEANFLQMVRSRCLITLLRTLAVICQRGTTGQRNDNSGNSLETLWKTLNFRQPNNKSAATFEKDIKESFGTAIEIGGTDTFGLAAMREAIDDGVGNNMTSSQYFDDN